MKHSRNIAVSFLVAAIVAPSSVQAMPRYDPDAHCQAVSTVTGTASAMIYNGCMQNEQRFYDELKLIWDRLPENTQSHCNQIAKVTGTGSYMILKGCIDNEMRAAGNRPEFKF